MGGVLFDLKEPAASIDRLLLLPLSPPSPQERVQLLLSPILRPLLGVSALVDRVLIVLVGSPCALCASGLCEPLSLDILSVAGQCCD